MSHAPMLYDELSAIENLHYFAALHRDGSAAPASAPPRWPSAPSASTPTSPAPSGQYSQGMRQRASLARVLQTDPELLLLDEPFSNLDVASAQHMVELLADFRTWPVPPVNGRRSGARTILLTTHQAHLAEPLADTTLTMRQGQIVSTDHVTAHATDHATARSVEARHRPRKTNAARLLDSLGIPYELRPYEVDPDDLTAISVARKIGLPPEQVFKTLLTHDRRRRSTSSPSSPATPSSTSKNSPTPPASKKSSSPPSKTSSPSPATSAAASPSSPPANPSPPSPTRPSNSSTSSPSPPASAACSSSSPPPTTSAPPAPPSPTSPNPPATS